MDRHAAARRAILMQPDRPGVARLCQELLVEVYDLALSPEPFAKAMQEVD